MTALLHKRLAVQKVPLTEPEKVPLPAYSRHEVRQHCDETSCWIIIEDKVYDVTRFLPLHPGGSDVILEHAGGEASAAFWEKSHTAQASRLLSQYYIGKLQQHSH